MTKPLVVAALVAFVMVGSAANAGETSVYGGVERGRGSISISSDRSLAGALVHVGPIGAPTQVQIGRFRPYLDDHFGTVSGLDLSVGTVYAVTIFYAKGPFEHLRFAAYGAGDCLAPEPSTGPELQAVLLRDRAPRWAQPPVVDAVRPVEPTPATLVGAVTMAITTGPVEPGTLLAVKVTSLDGTPLWTGIGRANDRGPTNLCPEGAPSWPERVIAVVSLVDLTERSSATVRSDVEVLRRPAPEVFSLVEKLLLFGAVPFGVGYLTGGRVAAVAALRGRRSTARRC